MGERIMTDEERETLYHQLLSDEAGRNKDKYIYTNDAIRNVGITPYSIWPESNENVRKVINGEIDYNDLPYDWDNEPYKGGAQAQQQDIIMPNQNNKTLCEALSMKPCLKKKCELYRSKEAPPVCKEFKMAFEK